MLALVLVCVHALDSSRVFLRREHPLHAAAAATEFVNATNATAAKPVAWDTFVGEYCGSFCNMSGVDAGHCTLCAQRMNFTVEEGKVSCAVECQGVQTDRVTEEAVSCSARLDACMFTDVDAAACKLECTTQKDASCAGACGAFKAAQRASGNVFGTFYGNNEVATKVEKEVNGTNGTELQNVTVMKVAGVEPLPTAAPGAVVAPVPAAAFRFHVNESVWRAKPKAYCGNYYCNAEAVGVAGVDAFHCVECVNRLNNSVEAGLTKCRVSCEMRETDAMTGGEYACGDRCLNSELDVGTCYLECALPMNEDVPDCMKVCEQAKAAKRAEGVEVRPYGWPAPPTNGTNGTNGTDAAAAEK